MRNQQTTRCIASGSKPNTPFINSMASDDESTTRLQRLPHRERLVVAVDTQTPPFARAVSCLTNHIGSAVPTQWHRRLAVELRGALFLVCQGVVGGLLGAAASFAGDRKGDSIRSISSPDWTEPRSEVLSGTNHPPTKATRQNPGRNLASSNHLGALDCALEANSRLFPPTSCMR